MILESTIRRIMKFDNKDWKHIIWLIRTMFIGVAKLHIDDVIEAWRWIRIHCEYDNKIIKENK